MGKDAFLTDLESASATRDRMRTEMDERDRLVGRGESTARVDAKLRGQLQQFAIDVDSLVRMLSLHQADPPRFGMSTSEIERRRKLVQSLEADLNRFDEEMRKLQTSPSSPKVAVKFGKNALGEESEETKVLSNEDLKKVQRGEYRRQEEVVDQILGTTENLKTAAQNIGDEVDVHMQLLDKLDDNVDGRQQHLERTNRRMMLLIKKSADGMMICCIVVLIITLVLILVLA